MSEDVENAVEKNGKVPGRKITGYRQLIKNLAALACFTLIIVRSPTIDPFNLGMGVAMVMTADAAALAAQRFGGKSKKE